MALAADALVVGILALAAAGCGGDDDEAADDHDATSEDGSGAAGRDARLRGRVRSGRARRRARLRRRVAPRDHQIFETLVALKPGTTEPVARPRQSWEVERRGKSWTFKLRKGVTFHDGEPFNAEAVCFNFDRWYNFTGALQSPSATYYWQSVFGGFATTTRTRRARGQPLRELRGDRRVDGRS